MTSASTSVYKASMLAGLMVVSVVGCGASHPPNGSSEGSLDLATNADPAPVTIRQKMNREQQIAHAKKHLAEKLKIDQSEISLAGAQAVTWRSGAMGCPKPGMMYTMALVPGMLMVLNVAGRSYRYHASTNGEPAYCPAERAESPGGSPADM